MRRLVPLIYPNNLAIYLSNRCNLACSYCYVAVRQDSHSSLDIEAVKKAVDYFLALPRPEQAGSGPQNFERKISFLGGEPLLQFDALQNIIQYARRADPGAILHVFTNATLLTPKMLDFFLKHRVEITVSLDGRKESNDRRRSFRDAKRSVFEEVMKRLEGLPVDLMGVNMVFTQESLNFLLADIHFFYERGFSRISFAPDFYEIWELRGLKKLESAMTGFIRYYRRLAASPARLFSIANLYAALEKSKPAAGGRLYWWQDCRNLILGPDGRFYNCDKPMGFTLDKVGHCQVGGVETGVNWQRRDADFKKAALSINKAAGEENFHSCPMGAYFAAGIEGKDCQPAVLNFQKVSGIYSRALLELFESLKHNSRFLQVHQLRPDVRVLEPAAA